MNWAEITNWLERHQTLLEQAGTLSLIMLAITVVAFPIAVSKLPEDYFVQDKREPAARSRKHPLFWGIASLLKNLLGVILILAGIAMLALPGQGTVTILIGLALTNFPGKYALERRIASQPAVGKTLNKIRGLAGCSPLRFPNQDQDVSEVPLQ